EVVAGTHSVHPHRRSCAALDLHLGLARLDNKEIVAHFSLANDELAGTDRVPFHELAQDSRLRTRKTAEQISLAKPVPHIDHLPSGLHRHILLRHGGFGQGWKSPGGLQTALSLISFELELKESHNPLLPGQSKRFLDGCQASHREIGAEERKRIACSELETQPQERILGDVWQNTVYHD